MSLRELPPEQSVARGRLRRLRFVPLGIILVLTVVIGGIGFVTSRREAAHAIAPAPVPTASAGSDSGSALPAALCHPAVAQPGSQPWLGAQAAASEKTWQAHSDELTTAIVHGEDGWVDWGDIQAYNFSQAVGRHLLTNDQVLAWHDYFAGIRDELARRGIPFYVVITPSKFNVYPQEEPAWAQTLQGSVPLDQLLAASPDLPIIDVRQTLRDASATEPVFSKVNSHWTDYGAYLAWKQIAACVSAESPKLGTLGVPAITGVDTVAGPNEFAPYGVADPAPDATEPVYANVLRTVDLSTTAKPTPTTVEGSRPTGLDDLPATTTTAGAQSDAGALILRDSFGSALSILFQQSFATTWQVRHNIDGAAGTQADIPALVAQDKPDVVIFQLAARHLSFLPPVG